MFLYYILFSVIFSPLNSYTIIYSSKHSPPPPPPPPLTYLVEVNGLPKWQCVIWFWKMSPNVHLYPQEKSYILKMGWQVYFKTFVPTYWFMLHQIPETVNVGSSTDASLCYMGELRWLGQWEFWDFLPFFSLIRHMSG